MNILFLTLVISDDITERGIYNDLMRKFRDEGHQVYIICPSERRLKKKSSLTKKDGITIIKIKWFNIQKCNSIEKGISTLFLDNLFVWSIKKYLHQVKFDLVLYSTPPITFEKSLEFIKRRDNVSTYLLLKDIFPQNAVDMGLIKKNSIIYRYFRKKEKRLYQLSDNIGCMSQANVDYLLNKNKFIDPSKVEVNPNSLEPVDLHVNEEEIKQIKEKFKIPDNKFILLYGGNLGVPQGIDFLIQVLDSNKSNSDLFFLIIGSGTTLNDLLVWFKNNNPANCLIIKELPKNEYDKIVQIADVGLIFLDKNFTIPNFPSRLLSYLENKIPVLLATDLVSDMGKIAEENNFGFWSASGDLESFNMNITRLKTNNHLVERMGELGYQYFIKNFTTVNSYKIIMNHFN